MKITSVIGVVGLELGKREVVMFVSVVIKS